LRETGAEALASLTRITLQCYYRDDRVMRSLGMEPRSPFPEGFELEQGDWSPLDPVRLARNFIATPVDGNWLSPGATARSSNAAGNVAATTVSGKRNVTIDILFVGASVLPRGTGSSNRVPSSGESHANLSS
jgi:hypothetical protein